MNKRMRYIQLALEAAIPVLGFFVWNWSLYFILLFYFLDLFASEIVMHLKARQVVLHQGKTQQKAWLSGAVMSSALLVFVILAAHAAVYHMHPEINFVHEIAAFWNYEEMGIPQGYMLAPLLLLMSFQQFRFEFMMPARYRTTTMKALWKPHYRALLLVALGALFAVGLSMVPGIPEVVYVSSIVAGASAYSLLVKF